MRTTAVPLSIRDLTPPPGGSVARVLVVERNAADRSELAAWLRAEARAAVAAFSTAEEALTQSNGDSYDLCLLDYALEGVDGVMLGAMIRALNPGATLVLMSEAVSSTLVRRAVEHGFQTVLAKPVGPAELTRLLADQEA